MDTGAEKNLGAIGEFIMTVRANITNKQIISLVRRYNAEHGRDACLSSIVRAWLRVNDTSPHIVGHSDNIQRVAEVNPADDLEAQIIAVTSGEFSLKQTEVAFGGLIGTESKRSEGTVYTPNYIIDYVVNRCVEMRSMTSLPKLVDPACGSGGFLVRAVPILSNHYNILLEKIVNDLIYGIDINELMLRT